MYASNTELTSFTSSSFPLQFDGALRPVLPDGGQVGIDIDSGKLVSGGTYEETRAILHNMHASLPDFGLTLANLMHATIFSSCFKEFPLINRAWEEFFVTEQPPARSSVGVSQLPLTAQVEIEFRFYKESM